MGHWLLIIKPMHVPQLACNWQTSPSALRMRFGPTHRPGHSRAAIGSAVANAHARVHMQAWRMRTAGRLVVVGLANRKRPWLRHPAPLPGLALITPVCVGTHALRARGHRYRTSLRYEYTHCALRRACGLVSHNAMHDVTSMSAD